MNRLVGNSNEATVLLENIECKALLDTGSQISSISQSFYLKHFSQISLQPLENLHVEGVTGQHLPYAGFIEIKLTVPIKLVGSSMSLNVLLLVVADTPYNSRTPVLLGTNVLNLCLQSTLPHKVDDVDAPTVWWSTFKCLTASLQTRGAVGIVHCAESAVISARSSKIVKCFANCNQVYSSNVLLEESNETSLPGGLMFKPSLHDARTLSNDIFVEILNISDHDVTIPGKSSLGEIHEVDLVNPSVAACASQCTTESPDIMTMIDSSGWDATLTDSEKTTAASLLNEWKSVFALNDLDLGKAEGYQHRIHLTDDVPVKLRYGQVHPTMIDEVRKHLHMMKDMGVISPSKSPYCSPVVIVRKKSGDIRLCVDYRKLNQKCSSPGYSLPRVHEALDCLSGCQYFSCLDLKSGYWQLELHPDDRPKTAFSVGPLGFFEWNRMPFGLAAAPASFQQMMETVIGSLNLNECLLYLDDIIIFSKTFEEHITRLRNVFQKLSDAGLKLNAKKCCFFQTSVKYLGHMVSAKGVEACPDKVKVVKEWPIPTSFKDLRKFLGFAGFYRRFVKNFAGIAQPLHELLKGKMIEKGQGKKKFVNTGKFSWEDCHQASFDHLKKVLTESPVLGYADYSLPFSVSVDASGYSIGAVLYQVQNGLKRVIAYASRGLTQAEKRYPTHKREFLALKWAVCEKFRDYLYYSKFEVITDNNPITYVLSSAKVDATGHRWLADLSNFSFKIKYKPGPQNKDADALSRICWSEEQVKSALSGVRQAEALLTVVSLTQDVLVDDDVAGNTATSPEDWQQIQSADSSLRSVVTVLNGGKLPVQTSAETKLLMREIKSLFLEKGVLCRKRIVNGVDCRQIVLPVSQRRKIFHALHTDLGHPGRDKTLEVIRTRFFWPKMTSQIDEWIKACPRCLRRKSVPDVAPLHSIHSTQPMELVCIDYLCLEACSGNYSNILVITDHFTRYAQAIPTTNQTAKTTAKALFELFVRHYGLPQRLHSDQGGSFEGKVVKELCQLLGIQKSRTSPYHPMGNGVCERYNRTLLGMLGTMTSEQKSRWKEQLPHIVHAYNCLRNDSTGFSPFELMYGRQPRLPVDMIFSLQEDVQQKSYTEYITDLQKKLKRSYEIAIRASEASKEKNAEYYKSRGASLKLGDRVLVKRLVFKDGRHKLADKWEEDTYIVVSQVDPDIPVFDVRKENNPRGGRCKRLHRNHLLPIGCVQDMIDGLDGSGSLVGDGSFVRRIPADESDGAGMAFVERDSEKAMESEVEEDEEEELDLYVSSSDDDGDGGVQLDGQQAAQHGAEPVPAVYEPAVNAAPEARRTSSRQSRPVDRYQSIDFRR